VTSAEFRKVHDKLESGDSLTTEEVILLVGYYNKLVAALDVGCLVKYRIMHNDARQQQMRLKDILNARYQK
jgi:hypothetical protein